jgi:predicted AlkP superfamily phosphohydrolase/phosphomutase
MRRLVCLAFDSPDLALVQQGVDAGWLPTLGRLLEGGRFVPLDDMQDLLTSPMWPTLVTGTHVTDHLLLLHEQLLPGTYAFVPTKAKASQRPPFYRYVSDAGLRSTVASVYSAPLLAAFNGTQVVGWGSHDPYNTREDPPRADPPEVLRALERVAGRRAIRYGAPIPRRLSEFERYTGELVQGIEQQAKGLAYLLERTEWDFFFGGFAEAHLAGHLYYHFGIPEHPRHDPAVGPALKGALTTIYRAVDRALGSLLERLPDDVPRLVVSPYAMGPHHHLDNALDPLLTRAGWLSRAGTGVVVSDDRRLRALALARRAVHQIMPRGLRARLGRLVPRDRWVGALAMADVDWSVTRAFPVPSDGASYLRLNLRGREPGGIVAPGTEYDRACDGLAELVGGLQDPATGERLVARVARLDAIFGTAPVGPLPDLLVQWTRRHELPAVEAPGIGRLEIRSTDPRTGAHWAPGFLLACGPGIVPSGSRRLAGPSARVVDVAATALALLGVPRPPELAGQPIPSIVSAAE